MTDDYLKDTHTQSHICKVESRICVLVLIFPHCSGLGGKSRNLSDPHSVSLCVKGESW